MRKYITLSLLIASSICWAQTPIINEVLASNKGLVKDQFGNSDDCLEIYNPSSSPIDISGYYLSDNKDSLTLWSFPKGTTIKANGYLIVWCDDEVGEPGLHTNFKLPSKGETIRLSNPQGKPISKMKYKRQYSNVSFGIHPEKADEKRYMRPTLGAKNSIAPVIGYDAKQKKDKIKIDINSDNNGILIYNKTGKTIKAIVKNKEDQVFLRATITDETDMIQLDKLPNGQFFLYIGNNIYRIVKN
ncbi:MAG: lamin tail domain-containing protein [Salibacteraceae bacterium]